LEKSNTDLSILKKYLEKSAEKEGEPSRRPRAADSPERVKKRRATLLARQNISQGLHQYVSSQSNVVSNEITPNETPAATAVRQQPSTGSPDAPAQILIIDEAYDQDLDKPEEIAFEQAKERSADKSSLKRRKTRASKGSAKKRTRDSGC